MRHFFKRAPKSLLLLCALVACGAPRFESEDGPGGDAALGGAGGGGAGTGGAGTGSAGASGNAGHSAGSGGSSGGSGGAVSDAGGDAPTCTGSDRCISVPSNWYGPVLVAAGPNASPACPGGSTLVADLFDKLDPGSGTCSCSCDASTAGCVSKLKVTPHGSSSCGNNCTASNVGSTCLALTGCSGAASHFNVGSPYSGACTAKAKVQSTTPPAFADQVRLCEAAGVTTACGGGAQCAKAHPGFESACIAREGTHSCPPGWNPRTYFSGSAGQASCKDSLCACGGVAGDCGTLVSGQSFGCDAAEVLYAVPAETSGCLPTGGWAKWLPHAAPQLSCAAQKATVPADVSQVAATGEWTVCCQSN